MAARLRARLAAEDGLTLIELITTLAILGLVLSAVIGMFVAGLHAEVDMNQRFQAQQEARLALTGIRQDIRTACADPTVYSNGQPVAAGTTGDTVTLSICTDPTTQAWSSTPVAYVTWCARDEVGHWGLFRESVATNPDPNCPTGATGIRRADWLTTASVFTYVPPAAPGSRPGLQVTFPVDANPASNGGVYRLADTIMLRNAPAS